MHADDRDGRPLSETSDERRKSYDSVKAGVLLGVALEFLFVGIALLPAAFGLENALGVELVLCLGLSQLSFLLPAILVASLTRRHELGKGLRLVVFVTFLLSSACWGIAIVTADWWLTIPPPQY